MGVDTINNDFSLSRASVLKDAVNGAIREMYLKSQPPLDIDNDVIEEDSEHPIYQRHYLSEAECEYIVNKYIDAYNIRNHVADVCDMMIELIDENVDIGIEGLNRGLFEDIKSKFKRCYEVESFRSTIYLGSSPTSNKESVLSYWKSKGVDLEIVEHDEDTFV